MKNSKKKIIYSTQVYFLDAAVEYVKLLTYKDYEVHLLIELSPNQLNANILNIDANLNDYNSITSFENVVDKWNLQFLESFFVKCKSVNFIIYSSKNIFKTFQVSNQINKFYNEVRPDYIHLDEFSVRQLFLLPRLIQRRKKIILNIHDPKAHSGEFHFLRFLYRKLLFRMISSYVVFSEFSKLDLASQLKGNKKIFVLKLMPYTVFRSFLPKNGQFNKDEKKYISFIGRISPYKGIEMFSKAIEELSLLHSNLKFYIGGKTIPGYNPSFLNENTENLIVKNKFLSNQEISEIVCKSQLIICPYKDATQSGVIMTAFALGCPVLVTNTGGLPEYVVNNKTGVVCKENTAQGLTKAIEEFLNLNKKNSFSENVQSKEYQLNFERWNIKKLKDIYR
ncbi:glycosyltransferase family 4 protein [Maribacter sp. R86514]|uniref:glycosyltransferase family 4 protein n=1 Tax=Maribacter sp. R86514 TaxID=3093854 RepID=UPI0037CBDA19